MKDIELELRIRNNQLKERRESLGLTQKEMASAIGINLQSYSHLEQMKASPLHSKTGKMRQVALMIADYYGVDPEVLFPPITKTIEKTVAVRKMDENELAMLSAGQVKMIDGPDVDYDTLELAEEARKLISCLSPREEKVIRMTFGIGEAEKTIREIADSFEVSRQTIFNIKEKALEKIKEGHRLRSIREFALSDEELDEIDKREKKEKESYRQDILRRFKAASEFRKRFSR